MKKKEAVFSRPRSFRFDNNISDFRDNRYWPSNNIYYTKQKCPDIRALIFPHISNNIKSAISFDEYNYLHYYTNNKIRNHNITLLHRSECYFRETLSKTLNLMPSNKISISEEFAWRTFEGVAKIQKDWNLRSPPMN